MTNAQVIEEKLNVIKDKLSELEDLELVNKLDIINLKNEIEKVKLGMPTVSPEVESKVEELARLAEKARKVEKVEDLAGEIENIKSALAELSPEKMKMKPKVIPKIIPKVMRCPKCGAELKPRAKFCGKCGKKL